MQSRSTQKKCRVNQKRFQPERSHPDPAYQIVQVLKRHLTKPQAQNLALLAVAMLLAKSFLVGHVALCLGLGITEHACQKRIQRILRSSPSIPQAFQRAWVRCLLTLFAPGRKRVPLLIDWTLHKDICKSLWIAIPIGGRAVPLMFWLAPAKTGGKGTQRAFEDAALRQFVEWLPQRRQYVLIGDRGFCSLDRIAFLQSLGLPFLLRLRALTHVLVDDCWRSLEELVPHVGQRWQRSQVGIGKKSGGKTRLNLVAVREALRSPKAHRNFKGHKTGKTLTQTSWFLVTDLPLENDIVELYGRRMQIEQFFRDLKSFLDLEQTRLFHQEKRLEWLLWASVVGWVMSVLNAPGLSGNVPGLSAAASNLSVTASPTPEMGRVASAKRTRGSLQTHDCDAYSNCNAYSNQTQSDLPRYAAISAFREGLHILIWRLIHGTCALTPFLHEAESKSEQMRRRPQVTQRRQSRPHLIKRVATA